MVKLYLTIEEEIDMMKYGHEMEDPEMEGMEGMKGWWMNLPEDKKKAVMKATFDFKMKKLQLKMDYMKEIQKIFG